MLLFYFSNFYFLLNFSNFKSSCFTNSFPSHFPAVKNKKTQNTTKSHTKHQHFSRENKDSMEESPAQRRLKAVHCHLIDTSNDLHSPIQHNLTSAHFVHRQALSVILPEKLQTGKWNVYRSAHSPLKLVSGFPDHPDIGTLHDNFIHAVETFRDREYLGTRIREDGTVGEYKWMTYGEAGTAREAIGSGLRYHGLPKGVSVGLYFINRPEWLVVDHACSAYSYISVPLYDTLGPDAVKETRYVLYLMSLSWNLQLLSFISEIPSVHLIVVVGGVDEHLPSLPSTSKVKLISYLKLLSQGHSSLQPFCPPKPEDIATICYTSGTTGTPKGVVLTHGNLISSVAGFSVKNKFYPSDIYLSYLPLAHIYERTNQIVIAYYGVAVGFYQGQPCRLDMPAKMKELNLDVALIGLDNLKLMDDLAALKPTIFCSVPRLYNRIYAVITNAVKASGTLRLKLFTAAYNSKKQAIMKGQNPSVMWDRLVFNKMKEKLGGQVRFMASAASPLSPDVMEFLKVCFGCRIMEGYGLTETSGMTSGIDDGDNLTGHVGSPNPACEVKLMDVPEMNYTSEDQPYPRGEICVRGPIVFQGYYKDEVHTREVFDDDGWLHTGDIGLWLPGGRLKIIDRKKNIFKLAQGEYVAPEKIENVYSKCKFVAQCFIYGDSLKSCLVAVVAVDPDVLKEQLCNDPRARTAVLNDMNEVGKEGQIKRPQAKEYFAKAISNMYAELSTSDPTLQNASRM
ncbi:hypothetical protein JRO89_XSUnG0123300 [Xanthoceras sorbifolium]|uniref:AMP-dependent synthetase/ligase domain-containing protein n=1 Tax=Xanthoceras sorbifolium TaxID=99658 RepID=A0ABQ8GYD3_9ROSI|nr:hypothetical protein JRO89_XSUnG0123300 [Xanthoceras sorbifolium]